MAAAVDIERPGAGGADAESAVRAGSRPVHVCFLIDRLAKGGTETQLLALIRHLDPEVVRPCLVLLDGEDETSRALEPDGCPVMRLGVKKLLAPRSIGKLLEFRRFLLRERTDILLLYFPDSTYFGVLAGRLAGVPSIVRTRNNINHWMTPIHRMLGRVLNPFVRLTVCNSEAARRAVLNDERPEPKSVVVVENGVDMGRFAHIPTFEPAADWGGPRRVGMIANLRPVKGVDVFVRAAALVAREHPNVTFHVAGEGPQRPALEASIADLGLTGRFHLDGLVTDIPSFLARLDVAVLSSRAEGLPNAVLEALAAGRPVVAASVGGVPSIIADDVHGLLVPPESPGALASAVAALLNDPARAARLARAGRRQVHDRFSRGACVARFQDLFSRVRQAGAPARR